MVVGITELKKLLSRVRTSAGRGASYLNRISKSPLNKPSMAVVYRMGNDCQKVLGYLKEIIDILNKISG